MSASRALASPDFLKRGLTSTFRFGRQAFLETSGRPESTPVLRRLLVEALNFPSAFQTECFDVLGHAAFNLI